MRRKTIDYTPRRASKKWLAGAPEYILDVIDDPLKTDRYTILLCGTLLIRGRDESTKFADTWIPYLGMDLEGASCWGELEAYQASAFRYRKKHHRVKWLALPENVRKAVQARVEAA